MIIGNFIDNLGFKISEATDAYAANIGKTVEELTDEERSMAILNATFQAGQGIINQQTETRVDTGISNRAHAIAREIDILPAGEYCIILKKEPTRSVPWHAVISRMDRLRVMYIAKKG